MFLKDPDALALIAMGWKLAERGALTAETQREKRWAKARASAFVEAATALIAEREAETTGAKMVRVPTIQEAIDAMKALVGDPALANTTGTPLAPPAPKAEKAGYTAVDAVGTTGGKATVSTRR